MRSIEAATADAAILIVDDNAGKRLSMIAVLETLGHTIVEADSGETALREVMQRSFAVILMDVQMPVMDGYETARMIRLRADSESTPIIFVTAHMRDEADTVAYASGAVDFIWAPIVPSILRAKVAIFVELFQKTRELERSLRLFRDGEAQTRSVLDNVADGIITFGDDQLVRSFNRAACDLFGYTEREAIGQSFSRFATRALSDRAETEGRRRNGSTFAMEVSMGAVELASGKVHIACVRDISERRLHTEALQHQALHDDLTGLPNRVLFADRAAHAIRASLRSGGAMSILVMDLDGFKHVNDTLGHQHGDILLKLVTERLVGCLRAEDTVARLGGDEFGILAGGAADVAGVATVVWRIQQALEPLFLVNDHALEVRASIGIVLVPEHGDNIDDLLRRADLAMYDAKRAGSGYAVFAAEQEETPARRLALLGDLRHCIQQDGFVLHYQPKIDLQTQRTIGVEALIRWNHPSGRLFMPDEFMPEVENSALMLPLTEWVINDALRQLRAWRDAGYDLTMAVNVGARCLAEGGRLFETVDELCRRWGVPPDRLTLELTESALIDTAVPDLMERLNRLDQRLSIDDFGTGYSSLVYLQRLPVTEIKADRSFVGSMATVDDDAVIVHSIVDLAHNLGLRVVAEGVEDAVTMDLLIAHGCDEAQGYYFSRPLPGDGLAQWLETSAFGQARGFDATLTRVSS